jgi:hypothetical protein
LANALPLWERPHVTARVRPFVLVVSGGMGARRRKILPLCPRCNCLLSEPEVEGRVLNATGERWFGGHTHGIFEGKGIRANRMSAGESRRLVNRDPPGVIAKGRCQLWRSAPNCRRRYLESPWISGISHVVYSW